MHWPFERTHSSFQRWRPGPIWIRPHARYGTPDRKVLFCCPASQVFRHLLDLLTRPSRGNRAELERAVSLPSLGPDPAVVAEQPEGRDGLVSDHPRGQPFLLCPTLGDQAQAPGRILEPDLPVMIRHAVVEVASVLEPVGPGAALMVSREVDQAAGLRIAPEQGFKPQEGLLVERARVHGPPPPAEEASQRGRAEIAVVVLLHRSREESGC